MARRRVDTAISALEHRLVQATEGSGRTLDLSDLRLTSFPEVVGQFQQLQELNLSGNQLTSLPETIGQLQQLQELNLSGNQLTSLPEAIGRLQQLKVLNLSGNQLTSLPEAIGQLQQLQVLFLSRNQLTSLPQPIGQLQHLLGLFLSSNQLTSLPETIGQLQQLKVLRLSANQLTSLPEAIGQLQQLHRLGLSGNQLTSLPEAIGRLQHLLELHLSGNQLTSLPETIGQLQQLLRLSLSGNQLTSLPEAISQFQQLRLLDLSHNQLMSLPEAIRELQDLRELYLHDNELLSLLPEVLGPTSMEVHGLASGRSPKPPNEILAHYFESQTRSARPLAEAKVLLVGQGGVGKTSLVKCLVEDIPCTKHEPPTKGIRRTSWTRNARNPKSRKAQGVSLNLWDFGGQEIMHATHQFFLTKRSLYLLVVDARNGEAENNLHYWLKIIQSFGGSSPVLVVINKCEGSTQLDLNENRLRQDFAPNIKGFLRVSCQKLTGIGVLRRTIDQEIAQLEHVFDPVPPSYFQVKEVLDAWADRKNYIAYSDFEQLCHEKQIEDPVHQERLLRFLHDLGTALNFHDPDSPYELHDTSILNPEWVTDAVYRIITHSGLKEAGGVLKKSDLAAVLGNKRRFPPRLHAFIIDLMRKFELCFDFPDSFGDRWLVPELLSKNEPDVGWNKSQSLSFQIRYNVLPPGLICRFIVKMHQYLKEKNPTYWRFGAVLYIHGNRCLVRADPERRTVFVTVQEALATQRESLALIREKFGEIHRTIPRLEAKEWVPLPNNPEVAVEYGHLLELIKKGIDRFLPQGADTVASARELLEHVDSEQRREIWETKAAFVMEYARIIGEGRRVAQDVAVGSVGRDRRPKPATGRRDDRGLRGTVDYGIITIKEEEFLAVTKRFQPYSIVNAERGGYVCCDVKSEAGKEYRVLITRCLEQGQTDAQQCANDLLADAAPRWIFLVGIAGAVPAIEYTLGDVLLASRVYDFAVTAAIQGREAELNSAGGPVHPAVARLLRIIPTCKEQAGLRDWNGVQAIAQPKPALTIPSKLNDPPFYGDKKWREKVRNALKANFAKNETPRPPIYRVASVATANTLVKDTELVEQWLIAARSIGHIEMELGGVYKAAATTNTPVLSIRGISDIVGFRRSTAWTEYACQSAAAFARALICSGLIDPRVEQSTAPD